MQNTHCTHVSHGNLCECPDNTLQHTFENCLLVKVRLQVNWMETLSQSMSHAVAQAMKLTPCGQDVAGPKADHRRSSWAEERVAPPYPASAPPYQTSGAGLSAGHIFQTLVDDTAHVLGAGLSVSYAEDLIDHSPALSASLPGCSGVDVELAGVTAVRMTLPRAVTSRANGVDLASKSLSCLHLGKADAYEIELQLDVLKRVVNEV